MKGAPTLFWHAPALDEVGTRRTNRRAGLGDQDLVSPSGLDDLDVPSY